MGQIQEIWNLQLLHEYYQNGKSKDFIIEPTLDTKSKLQGLNWLTKSEKNSISVLGTDSSPKLEIPLRFVLKLNNSQFYHYTDVAERNGYIHWYKFQGSKIEESQTRLFGSVFTYQFQSETKSLKLRVEDLDGQLLSEISSHSNTSLHEFSVDLNGFTSGRYLVKVLKATKVLSSETVYVDDKLVLNSQVFAIAELLPQQLKSGAANQIQFHSKKESWKFYFISSKESEDVYILKDESKGNGSNRYGSTRFVFSERPVTKQIEGTQVTCFETGALSDEDFTPQLIPAFEESKKNLVLYRYGYSEVKEKTYYKSRSSRYRRRGDDDDDDDYFIYKCIERSIWDKRLRRHLIEKRKHIYKNYKLRKKGTKVISNIQNPSSKQLKKEVYIYI